jgi:hypothetical protein
VAVDLEEFIMVLDQQQEHLVQLIQAVVVALQQLAQAVQ